MTEIPFLMENTKIRTFSLWNEKVYNRNKRFFRAVYRNEVTPAMCKSAGISPDEFEVEPEVVVEEAPEVVVEKEAPAETRPNVDDWDEDKLRAFAESNDIPTHPAAKTTGLRAAINRYFDELEEKPQAGSEAE